jgi:IS1 family transposase
MAQNCHVSYDPAGIGVLNSSPKISVRDRVVPKVVALCANQPEQINQSLFDWNGILYFLSWLNNERLGVVLHVVIQRQRYVILKFCKMKGLPKNLCAGSPLIHDDVADRPRVGIWNANRWDLGSVIQYDSANNETRSMRQHNGISSSVGGDSSCSRLFAQRAKGSERYSNTVYSGNQQSDIGQVFGSKQATEIAVRVICGPFLLYWGGLLIYHVDGNRDRRGRCYVLLLDCIGMVMVGLGLGAFLLPIYYDCRYNKNCKRESQPFHNGAIVLQKYLDNIDYCSTVIDMANILPKDKQIAVVSALAEGSSIRSIERMTGINRNTIMNLGVRVGKGCTALLDEKMRNLPCRLLQFDEVWGFIGKKERHVRPDDDPQYGDVWTFCAIDAETKLVPSFKCGKRNLATAKVFVDDVASRMRTRVQISSDALRAYVDAIEQVYGADVDYGQIVKNYEHDDAQNAEQKYSAARFVSVEKRSVTGSPDMDLVSTSYIERLNATTRLHMRRLTRLTHAFSKKFENFEAAVGLHFAYYNLVRRHGSLRMTQAMAAGIERDFWSVGDLVEAAA